MKESAASEIKTASASVQRKAGASSPLFDEQGARNGPLMSMVQRAGCSGCAPALASLAGRMAEMPAGSRKEAALSLQRAKGNRFVQGLAMQAKEQATPNKTGMPDQLKSGLENLSGLDLSGVRVHYSSSKPAQLNALAYTQGQEIHVAPGQEKHLPHEGWHVVQQAQGRVQATTQARRVALNDDVRLESEADVMGKKAATGKLASRKSIKHVNPNEPLQKFCISSTGASGDIIQRQPQVTGVFLDPTPEDQSVLRAEGDPLHCIFQTRARFDLVPGNTDYKYGEYRQYVKGVFLPIDKKNPHYLGNKPMSISEWNEDVGKRSFDKYGYRSGGRGAFKNADGELNRPSGRYFESWDEPNALPEDDEMDLYFKGVLIDTGDQNREVAAREWRIHGKKETLTPPTQPE